MADRTIRAVGIDLGTTNSAVTEIIWNPASAEPSTLRTLEIEQPTREGTYTSPLIPSVVAILPDDTVWVGEGAKRLRAFPVEYGLVLEKNLFYDTKNEMGLRKTYFRAPSGFNHASKIGGKVLEFIAREATRAASPPDYTAVTVPASFMFNQRRDTLHAAQYAGLSVRDDDLLDEPTAAIIDYFISRGGPRTALTSDETFILPADRPALCVVFDFGGGTCDVSVVEISLNAASAASPNVLPADGLVPPALRGLSMSQLSVSRYHRLGGGDIDVAIVHDVLIPCLLAENNLGPLSLTWAQKKKGLEPQLLGKAEALKIALCSEINRLTKFNRYAGADKSAIVVHQPSLTCSLGKTSYRLSNPSLSAGELERLLAPFLDADFLFARETEFRLTQSIFAPLQDAIDRADRDPSDVDLCLMVGGSTLIPQVRNGVRAFFPNSRLVFSDDGLEAKLCVSRGAAWNAAVKGLTGRPLIEPVLHDGIVLLTSDGKPNPLIPSRTSLPFPEDGSFLQERLKVPAAASAVRELRFEVVGQEDRQHIFDEVLQLPEDIAPGAEILLEYRVTGGKQFECRAYLAARPSVMLEKTIENPLVNIANPNATQLKIEEAEEKLRLRKGGTARDRDTYVKLARLYAELNQRERALDMLRAAQSRLLSPDPAILNLQGIYFAELGDLDRAEKAYLEADRIAPEWGGPLFNLALAYRNAGRHAEALETIDKAALKADFRGPYIAFKAMCQQSLGSPEEAVKTAAEALRKFTPPGGMDDWELGWFLTAARMAGDESACRHAEKEYQTRRRKPVPDRDGIPRPEPWGDIESKK
jgi:molecular chaperone DnaK